jgi:steroid 5-alpha reductase family enzyme
MINAFMIPAATALFLALLFYSAWIGARHLDNYSIVDVVWACAFAPVALLYALGGDGWGWRRLLVCLLVAGWSARLGIYLWRRVASHHPAEDARYTVLRQRWPDPRPFLWFFLAQGLLVWLLMLPLALICSRPEPHWHWLELAGLALCALGLAGEALADAQLSGFKKTNRDPKAVCRAGLWNWSRHPNYFFQSLLWWGLFLIALPAPWGWISVVAPLAMLHFLLKVTGIPLTEKLALEKRGDSYREYQRTTSAFIPLPPRQVPPQDAAR